MEKKTIGKFISALRRASGMTQKELGEKLYVSDKTVSRWERDECTPELSLIPAIAAIFGITTDELLRGERNHKQTETTQSQKSRSDKQFKIMLHNRMVRFRNLSIISLGVALASAILAFVINESFFKGTLAFGIGAVLIVAAFVCQFCFASSSLLRLDDEDDAYETEIRRANTSIVTRTAGVLIAVASMFAFILPMGIWGGSYYSLSTGSALGLGILFALMGAAVCHIVYMMWVRRALVSRGAILDEEEEITMKRRKLLKKSLLALAAALMVLSVVLVVLVGLGPESFDTESHQFTDLEEFRMFMEDSAVNAWQDETLRYYSDEGCSGLRGPGYVCIDIGNNGLYEEVLFPPEFNMAQIVDGDGNVLCEYVSEPNFVSNVEYAVDEATGNVSITVRSHKLSMETIQFHNDLCNAILVLMALSALGCMIVYLIRLSKIKYKR